MAFDSFPLLVQRAPAATPFTFTTIGEIKQSALPEMQGTESDASVQNSNIDKYVVSQLQRRSALQLVLNYLPGDGTQDHLTGLYAARIGNTFDGYKFLHSASSLIWIASGQVQKVSPVTPMEGVLGLNLTLRLSGAMYLNGLLIS